MDTQVLCNMNCNTARLNMRTHHRHQLRQLCFSNKILIMLLQSLQNRPEVCLEQSSKMRLNIQAVNLRHQQYFSSGVHLALDWWIRKTNLVHRHSHQLLIMFVLT